MVDIVWLSVFLLITYHENHLHNYVFFKHNFNEMFSVISY